MRTMEGITVYSLIMNPKTKQMTIQYGRDGKYYEQSGLSVCYDGTRHPPLRNKDGLFYELLFEVVLLPEHEEKEITYADIH